VGGDGPRGGLPQGGRGARLTPGTRACRVLPDVPAVDRAFDYLVPDALRDDAVVGAVVRVPLHGRRVRGWIVEIDVEPEIERSRLVPVHSIVSAGPPADIIDLCTWAAWRWAGPAATLLRVATPPNHVPGPGAPGVETAVYPSIDPVLSLPDRDRRVVRWPPGAATATLVQSLVDPEGSTIVIAPDPREDVDLVSALEAEGRHVLVWRADRSAADRTAAWDAARRGACVVLGGRTAAFAPVPDLRAVVVVDDADESLKEERTPAWHARDVAAERAHRAGARLDLVSPAPTVEAMQLAGDPIAPPAAEERAGWPRTEVVDLRDEPPGATLLSERLADALRRAVDEGGRAVCVLNRRGRARLLACRTCRELARCARCGAAVGADDHDAFACPRCGEERPQVCLACGGSRFRTVRPGVVRVREELAALIPRARVVAVDAGSAPLPAFDIAIGTEAVLHRIRGDQGRAVRLVAFLELDQELLAARYRAAEQALWLLVRAARLLGGRSQGGTLLLQSRLPSDPVVLAASAGDPSAVMADERARREILGYPPFAGLAEIAGGSAAVDAACDALRPAARILGPERDRALARAPSAAELCDAIAAVDLAPARALGRLRIDVDPLRV